MNRHTVLGNTQGIGLEGVRASNTARTHQMTAPVASAVSVFTAMYLNRFGLEPYV